MHLRHGHRNRRSTGVVNIDALGPAVSVIPYGRFDMSIRDLTQSRGYYAGTQKVSVFA
jgi:hypothetical protein